MERLARQVALITGAGAGIGAATALLFCREGAAVTLVDADAQAIERTIRTIEAEVPGASVNGFEADIVDDVEAVRAVDHCVGASAA